MSYCAAYFPCVEWFATLFLQLLMFILNLLIHTQASILVWRRFGSLGDIQVTGVAMVAPSNSLSGNEEAAVPNVDFSTIPVSVTMAAGTTSAYLNVSLVDNSETSSLKLFSFALTGIQRLPLTTGMWLSMSFLFFC